MLKKNTLASSEAINQAAKLISFRRMLNQITRAKKFLRYIWDD